MPRRTQPLLSFLRTTLASLSLTLPCGVAAAQVTVFQAPFQLSAVQADTTLANLDAGTVVGSWSFQVPTNINVYGNAAATAKALCPDSNGNGGYGLTANFTEPVVLGSNVTVNLKLARGRQGSPGTGKAFALTGYDELGNASFDLQVFANQNQAAGTNGALYWNDGGAYTNWFGTTYSVANDIRQIPISSTGYDPAGMSALTIQLQAAGYRVSLDRDNNGTFEWTSSLLPYQGSPTSISRIFFTGGNGSGNWYDDITVVGVPGSGPVAVITNGFVALQPENQSQLITGWGYDIKQGGKAAGLTPAFAQTLFVTDKMTILRLPIWGDGAHPAHPASGVVDASYYTDILYAMANARAANSNVILFASKKLDGTNSFPAWTKNATAIIPASYAELLADFLQFMEANGFVMDVLGIDNEENYNEGKITPSRYKDTIDALRALAVTRGFTMPARLIAPEDYGPEDGWLTTLVSSGWGDRCDLVGTHYYPQWRPLSKLQDLVAAGGARPAWHTEVHWDNDEGDVIQQAEAAVATVFDCTDTGLSGLAWWAYTRSNIKGGIEQALTAGTAGTRPVVTTNVDGSSRTLGRLIARAFRDNTNLVVWVLNNTTNAYDPCQIRVDRGTLVGPVQYTQWDVSTANSASVTLAGPTNFALTLGARTLTMATVGYVPPGPDALYALDGDVLDSSGHGLHGSPGATATNYIAGRIGAQALEFNGVDSFVQIPRSIGAGTNFSVAFWMKCSASGGTGNQWYNGHGLVDGEVSGTTGDFGITLLGDRVAFGVGSPDTTMRTSLAVNDGQWHHVAVTRNAFDGEMAIYLDGVLNTNTFGPTGPRTSPPVLRLGSLQSGVAGKFYQGAMDDVRLYNGLLSADSIAALATAPQPNAPPVMAPIADQTLIAGQVLNLTNNASDPDVPPQTLTWSLRSPPPGATINTNTGLIQWRPTIARSPGTNPMQVVVTDNGVPSLSDTQQFTVTVLKPVEPRMDSPQVAGGAFTTSVSGDAGPDYTVLGSTNLTTWSAILTTNPVTLPVVLQIPVSNAVPQQFYRIQLGP